MRVKFYGTVILYIDNILIKIIEMENVLNLLRVMNDDNSAIIFTCILFLYSYVIKSNTSSNYYLL